MLNSHQQQQQLQQQLQQQQQQQQQQHQHHSAHHQHQLQDLACLQSAIGDGESLKHTATATNTPATVTIIQNVAGQTGNDNIIDNSNGQNRLICNGVDNSAHCYTFILDELSNVLQERLSGTSQCSDSNDTISSLPMATSTAVAGSSPPLMRQRTSSLSPVMTGNCGNGVGGGDGNVVTTQTATLLIGKMTVSSTNINNNNNHQLSFNNGGNPSDFIQRPPKYCYVVDTTYHFKTLVPAVAAGAIIGKGGETIATLQKDTGARVKMSKSHDFYPGTSERVCLITGSIEAIMTVLDFIMDKIREKPDLATKLTDIETKQAQERDKQVKILVPNSTAGMIIGKAGAYIKQIKEESGSYVQISQKPKDITLQERCITIIGDRECNKLACKLIMSKIVEDPSSGTCLNVSYADMNGPVANYNPTGSPYAAQQNIISSSTASLNSALSSAVGGTGLLVNGTGINLSLNLSSPNPSNNSTATNQLLDHIKVAMRGSGYSDQVTSEVCSALGVLAKYGVLGVGVGLAHTNGAHGAPLSYLGVSALEQSANASGVFGAIGQVNLDSFIGTTSPTPRSALDRYEAAFDPFRHTGSQAATTPITLNNNSFGLATGGATTAHALGAAAAAAQTLGALSKSPTPGDIGRKETKDLEIPEVIVGAILGQAGRSLIEIQHLSGANVQISKKGNFVPGTRNRKVTITGPPNAITMATYLIQQRITEEESKRARQNTLTGLMQ